MRKLTVIAFSICLIMIGSCKKNVQGNGGSWTFRSQTYHSQSTKWVQGALLSYTGTSYPTGSLSFTFYDSTNHPRKGRFTYSPSLSQYIAAGSLTPDSGYVGIILTDTSATQAYYPTPGNQTSVTVSKSGNNYTVTVPPIMMVNGNGDSALLSGTIVQTP